MRQPLIITKIQLERAAKRAGCCLDFRLRILRARSYAELLDIYVKGIRFCMHHDYPKVDYCRRNFRPQEYHTKGIFINEYLGDNVQQHKMSVCLGSCIGDLHYGEFLVRRIVCKHNAHFNITVDDYAILMVDILDNALVTINASDHARVVAYYYGDAKPPKTDIQGTASIKVHHRPIIKNN